METHRGKQTVTVPDLDGTLQHRTADGRSPQQAWGAGARPVKKLVSPTAGSKNAAALARRPIVLANSPKQIVSGNPATARELVTRGGSS